MEAEALSSPPSQISPSKANMKSSYFPPLPPRYESNLVGAALQNNGNTCYLNAVLQCIIHTVPMLEKLRSSDHYLSCSGDGFCSLCALRDLIDVCLSKSGWIISPERFTDNLKKISPNFQLGEQEDAHEFLRCLLDNLHNCCLDPSSRNQPSSMDKDSLVKHVYGGRSISQLRCCECGHISNTPEPMLDLSLEIDDVDALKDALKSFTKVEKIEETKFTCEGCKVQVLMEKQIKIDQAPSVISLHLKRFKHTGWFLDKITKFVEYPLELDLKPFLSCPKDDEQMIYELYAVVSHIGSVYSGHYYCLVRSSPTEWHLMDDSKVESVSETNVLNDRSAYILFYIKQGSSPWFSSLMGAQKMKDSSPVSVLGHIDRNLSPSSAEETSSSSSRELLGKDEGPGPCPDVAPESITDHSLCTPQTCNQISLQNGAYNAVTSQFRMLPTRRPGSNHNITDMFHDEPLEDEKENKVIPQVHVGPKGNIEAGKTALEATENVHLSEPLRRLVRGMTSSRRSSLLAYLPPSNKSLDKNSPLTSKSQPLVKKRRKVILNLYPSDGEESPRQRPMMTPHLAMASSQSLSPHSVRRGLFVDDSRVDFEFASR